MSLNALCPLDGRYAHKLENLAKCFSEARYYKACVLVELKWLRRLSSMESIPECPSMMPHHWQSLFDWADNMAIGDIEDIKVFEGVTKHDVKAVENFVRAALDERLGFKKHTTFIHFGLTSEDVTNIAYAQMMKDAKDIIDGSLNNIILKLRKFSKEHSEVTMLARTHGQAASPTTLGKEFSIYYHRLDKQYSDFWSMKASAKMNGATGNYNALYAAYPNVDWREVCCGFINAMGLQESKYTNQVEPHDWIAEWFHSMIRMNNILIDFCQDVWQYMSLGYLTLETDRVGSSTMPHKINPIEFENAEGNLQLANSIMTFLADKMTKSRMQRDLSGSTVKRNLGLAFGYSQMGYLSVLSGLNKIVSNQGRMTKDLFDHPEVITEAVQTILRKNGMVGAYDLVKKYSNPFDRTEFFKMIFALPIPMEVKDELMLLNPENYSGLAAQLAEE